MNVKNLYMSNNIFLSFNLEIFLPLKSHHEHICLFLFSSSHLLLQYYTHVSHVFILYWVCTCMREQPQCNADMVLLEIANCNREGRWWIFTRVDEATGFEFDHSIDMQLLPAASYHFWNWFEHVTCSCCHLQTF